MNIPHPGQFRIDIPRERIEALQARIRMTTWPSDIGNEDWSYGFRTDYMQSLLHDWSETYDWYAAQDRMNAYDHFKVTIDGVPIHYMHIKGKGPAPKPLILSHGWPWTFWDMQHMIGPLTDPAAHGGDPADAFELIVPSLPGFGFSTPAQADTNFWKTADLWNTLMTQVLGFDRYFAAGADWGNFVTQQIGHKHAAHAKGIYITNATPLDLFNQERYWDISNKFLPDNLPPDQRKGWLEILAKRIPHVAVQTIEPQTLALALHDSPAGLLAWLMQPRRDWGQWQGDMENTFPREHMLTTATIYWLTGTYVSSARFYANAVRYPWSPSHGRSPTVEAPTSVGFFGGEFYPGMTVDNRVKMFTASPIVSYYNLHRAKAHPTGGHFIYYEEPEFCLNDIRECFRDLRW